MADGEDVRDLIPNDASIRLIHIAEGSTIGEKRNFGCANAQGQIVCHFDDDDFSAPGRIADQVARLEASGKAVFGYHQMLFTDGSQWWSFNYGDENALGTSLCYRKSWQQANPFPALQVEEDGKFCKVARERGQISTSDAGELLVASVHAGNTSPRSSIGEAGSPYKLLRGFKGVACV